NSVGVSGRPPSPADRSSSVHGICAGTYGHYRAQMIGRSRELVGRAAEAASLAAIVDHLADRGAALVIRGEPGIGKSALLLLLREQAAARGFAVLPPAGVEAGA